MPNGDSGGGFDFGGIFDSLLGALAAVVQAIIDFLNSLVVALVEVLNFLFQGELGIFNFSFKSLGEIFHGWKNIMDQIFKVWVAGALKHLKDLYDKLAQWAKKLKRWLEALRRAQRAQLEAMRKMLNLIQRVRRGLGVFKLLHIGLAKKLDNFLARLEGRISTGVLKHLAKTNEIIRWVNLVADPRGLLHPGGQLASVGGILSAVRGALGALKPGEFNCLRGQQTGPGVTVRPWVQVSDQLLEESKNKTGDSAAVAAQFAQTVALFNTDIGNVQNAKGAA